MKIILLQDVKKHGKKGEIIDAERIEMLQIEAERVFGLK